MKFLRLICKTPNVFDKIQNYDDVTDIVRRALNSNESYNLLFIGAPSSGKTLFLNGIMDIRKDGIFRCHKYD